MNSQMSQKEHHQISIGVRLTAIGKLKINGRTHQVTPLEFSTEKILFLCDWEIPVTSNVKFCYELDDSYDRILVAGRSLTREVWQNSSLYTAKLDVSENEKLRITGMLNRMMFHHFNDTPIRFYTNTGTVSTSRRLMSTIIQ